MAQDKKNPRTASVLLSMDQESRDRLKEHAAQRHTSVSQLVVDWIWNTPLRDEIIIKTEAEKND